MKLWFLHRRARVRILGWLLLLAFGALTLQPMHLHMVHGGGDALVDDHQLAPMHASALVDGFYGLTYEPVAENLLKSPGFHVLPLALIAALMVLLPRPAARVLPRARTVRPPKRLYYHRTPPLRAPPAL